MPSQRTRQAYDRLTLATAQVALGAAATAVAAATETLGDIQGGTLNLSAITVNHKRFVEDGGELVLEA